MYLSFLDILDLFIRFITVGQLSILGVYVLSKSRNLKSVLATALTFCLCSYLLLTSPIPDKYYGLLRGFFLFFTEIAPYILWCFAFLILKDNFQFKNCPKWVKVIIVFALFWFLYFFGYLQGKGPFHQVNHLIELCLLLHIVFISTKDLADDLVNGRRNIRILFIISICLYLSFILLLELGDSSLRASSLFSAINAVVILLLTTAFSWLLFNFTFRDKITALSPSKDKGKVLSKLDIPMVYQDLYQQLCQLMLSGFYKETQLSIKVLASKLGTPEHQLRELINKHLGFRNFSAFLNSYRLSAACEQLADVANLRKPILTIALELGYGSIATFNRAFKDKMGQTPKEYRAQFQK